MRSRIARIRAGGTRLAREQTGLGESAEPSRVGHIGLAAGDLLLMLRTSAHVNRDPPFAAARRNARDAGVADRVTFCVSDAADAATTDRYDLVTIFEALHDMLRPIDALRTARRALPDGGSALVADERVDDEFTAPAPILERHAYGWSVISCLPSAMGDSLTAAPGAVMRPATLRRYATAAGFSEVAVLPIDTGPFQFYRLIPYAMAFGHGAASTRQRRERLERPAQR